MLVDVPLLHLDRPFTYRVPPALAGQVHLGTRVKVPFGGRRRVDGWVVGRAPDLPPDARDLLRVVSPIPSVGPPELALFRWVADRYSAAVIDTLRLAVPPRVAAVEASLEGLWTAESSDSGDPLGSPSGGPSAGGSGSGTPGSGQGGSLRLVGPGLEAATGADPIGDGRPRRVPPTARERATARHGGGVTARGGSPHGAKPARLGKKPKPPKPKPKSGTRKP